ncbi:hypothetical protein L484_007264 [Morus notabilis]|uniref:Uncharacterized protein n=1 Tax=Morus notabilis TaxID=981085 RepID=W9RMQ7_9ROSA|nr:hypothetical protein L484_007264 [Morus notabilis]
MPICVMRGRLSSPAAIHEHLLNKDPSRHRFSSVEIMLPGRLFSSPMKENNQICSITIESQPPI